MSIINDFNGSCDGLGPQPENQARLAEAQVALAQALLDQAEASPAASQVGVSEARALLQESRALLTVRANAEQRPGLPELVLKQWRRAERLIR